MPNKNYLAGRRFEYDSIKRWREKGYACSRTAGSHGLADVIAVRWDRKPEFIQCKVTDSPAVAKRLTNQFKSETMPSTFYHQVLEIKVKGQKDIVSVTV